MNEVLGRLFGSYRETQFWKFANREPLVSECVVIRTGIQAGTRP
jgi:hypothetical protein